MCLCGENVFASWFGSVKIGFLFLFSFSAAVAVGCFGLRCDVSKRKVLRRNVSKRKDNVRVESVVCMVMLFFLFFF